MSKNASDIISGMGTGMSILTTLIKKGQNAGLNDEDFHQLAKPEGDSTLNAFIELMLQGKTHPHPLRQKYPNGVVHLGVNPEKNRRTQECSCIKSSCAEESCEQKKCSCSPTSLVMRGDIICSYDYEFLPHLKKRFSHISCREEYTEEMFAQYRDWTNAQLFVQLLITNRSFTEDELDQELERRRVRHMVIPELLNLDMRYEFLYQLFDVHILGTRLTGHYAPTLSRNPSRILGGAWVATELRQEKIIATVEI
jgi:hypothetical protein